MHLKHLSLTNFRSLTRLDSELPRRAVVLAGSNAQGKTSVLEAIYFLAAFTSFQTNVDRQIVNFHEAKNPLAVARLVADYQRGRTKHRLEVRLILEASGATGQRLRKEILLDGVKRNANDVIGHFNAVIFVPQMSQIIEGGPDERRRYLNLALAQAIPSYARALGEYSQALTQRNALLKALNELGGNRDQLEVWDEALVKFGAQIILWRIQAVQEIERLASRVHHELTRGTEILRLAYEPAYDPLPKPNGQLGLKIDTAIDRSALDLKTIQDGFLAQLRQVRGEEIARGVTTLGPHRDDLRFIINKADVSDYGSRGQIRTTLLALKLAEVEWMKERTGEYPVILLDEVMAELDTHRRADLLKYVSQDQQVLFTTTDLSLFSQEFSEHAEVWDVRGGVVTPRR
ncbi:MAG TPA: DNA replication/repair protein RecF [Anaerolineales bacterium]|nr:DNA replication/repair protein RecF [Anaerolineales bacterium]HNN11946.1 DNA replication/repair protein RecF [Anaerolineales bacterium]HNO31288.1 DNA replication/repair protein RecF [Anaerolineales bacterium]